MDARNPFHFPSILIVMHTWTGYSLAGKKILNTAFKRFWAVFEKGPLTPKGNYAWL